MIKTNNTIAYTLNKISFLQLLLLGTISLVYFFYKEYTIFSGFLISGVTLFSYIQLVKLSNQNKPEGFVSFLLLKICLISINCFIFLLTIV